MHRLIALVAPLTLICGSLRASDATPEQTEFFEQKIRPLFAEHCVKCHGDKRQKGGLRLDSREAVLKGGDTGPAIVPAKPDESELVRAIRYEPEGYQMPPDGKLPAAKIALLERWVADGAPWPKDAAVASNGSKAEDDFAKRAEHWSFQPLRQPAIPVVQRTEWARNPIDCFILHELEAKGLSPAPEAPRSVRLRRASFDVVGFAPSVEQVAGVDDFSSLIHEWLASPQFGERWGRHWLDLVRYAESRGHEFDFDVPNAWHYRDYVIRALNADVPYDQLVVEHVAGDLLANEKPDSRFANRLDPASGHAQSILGTGFWFFGEWVHSPVDLKQDEADRMHNMVEVFGKAFLGLTVGCARCHDHKFDPITQKDFTALSGYVASAAYVQTPFESLEHNRRIAAELARIDDEAAAIVRKWVEQDRKEAAATGATSTPSAFEPDSEQLIADFRKASTPVRSDGSCFGTRPRQVGDVRWSDSSGRPLVSVVETAAVEREPAFTAFRPAADVIGDMGVESWKRAGRTLITPTFTVGPGKVYAWVRGGCRTYAAINSHLTIKGPLHGSLVKDHPASGEWRWIEHDLSRYRGHLGHLEFVLREDDGFAVAMAVQGESPPPGPPSEVREPGSMTADDAHLLNIAFAENGSPATTTLQRRLQPLFERRAAMRSQIRMTSDAAPAMLEGNGVDLPLFVRGNPHKPADAVPRHFLEVFEGRGESDASELPKRLKLAHDIVDPIRNPIAARLIVNRIWQHYFGVGLVPSADDFGLMGMAPSHPDLLDWLAQELIRHDWSMKHIHRLILDSATYRMASYLPDQASEDARRDWAEAEQADPANVWLHRMPIKRLEGEALRDAILAASGRFDDRMYGRSIPVHLTEHHDGRGKPAVSGPLDGAGRRSIYMAVRRNFPDPLLQAFDFPVPSTTRGRRSVSNVPAQALALMNNPFVMQESARFAERVLSDPGFSSDDANRTTSRLNLAFQIAYARLPTSEETAGAREFLTANLATDDSNSDASKAWAGLCHALLNSKEFLFVP
jgi:cytochrome c553